VQIPQKLEVALIDLIASEQKSRGSITDVSKRITLKKLTDVYNNLSTAGFTRSQVESAMSNTIMCGGDLIDALDWLCLNIQNDLLPVGFSETLLKEEEKLRPKFDRSLQVEATQAATVDSSQKASTTATVSHGKQASSATSKKEKPEMKNWILQYAQQSSSDEDDDDDDDDDEGENASKSVFDPTARYIELHSQLGDLKDRAAIAKSNAATEEHKKLSKQLRELHLEMAALEKYPEFDKSIKSELKSASGSVKTKKKKDTITAGSGDGGATAAGGTIEGDDDDGEDSFGLGLFAAAEKEGPSKPKIAVVEKPMEEVRNFEYTRSQWTGKSPKQFLIDWVRKHLKGSPAPKFKKIQVKVDRFKSTCIVEKSKEDILSVTPDILCENVKDSEHLSCTLALYHLCRGQPVHQLLPPPYRNVWLDWADAEKKKKDEAKEKVDKPRDQFISKLMKKLNIEDGTAKGGEKKSDHKAKAFVGKKEEEDDDDEDEDDWEALADKGQLEDISPGTRSQSEDTRRSMDKSQSRNKDSLLSRALRARQDTDLYQELLEGRKLLPVFQFKEEVMSAVRSHNVVVIAGETGSGKSTQIPQFILEDCIAQGQDDISVICTEPRRISATSLAMRVSQEMGEGQSEAGVKGLDVGEPRAFRNGGPLVGYQIRFESRRGPGTRLVYCTTGVVLRQLQGSADLKGVTHLIIDEVHERSVQSDFLMIVVKEILARRSDLKVILMSATLDSAKFSAYFDHCPVINIPGRTFPVEVLYLEDAIEKTGYVVDDDSPYTLRENQLVKEDRAQVEITGKGGNTSKQNLTWTQEDISKIDRTDLSSDKYCLRTRNAVSRLNLNRINLDLISDLLMHIESSSPFCEIKGAVLIFLPGLADIQELYEMLTTQRHFSDPARYQIYALHSVLSSQDQGRVFSLPPPGVRKVVIATNIAETGITIPDVVYVIDSGKAKENRYMETSQMSALEEVFISRANCAQRAGRAGRVRPGFCFRLFTKAQHAGLKAYGTPELLRVPLEELCLNIMKCKYGHPHQFLQGALDPPSSLAVTRALGLLREVGACQADETTLTPLGHHLAALPVDVRIGKMLLLAAVFGCLEQVAVIAAAMTDKPPFVVPLSKKSEADLAKQALSLANSDHVTLLKAFVGWRRARQESRSAENSYINKNFLKKSTLMDIENVSRDLVKLVGSIGFSTTDSHHNYPGFSTVGDQPSPGEVLAISNMRTISKDELSPASVAIIKAVLTAGLYPQVGQVLTTPSVDISEQSSCLVETSQGVAQVHPSSVNRNLALTGSWLVYHEKVSSTYNQLRSTLPNPFQPEPLQPANPSHQRLVA
ncbi:ATP-dependent RNA helicase DHX29-like, partial [Elysia marginata]